MLQYWGNSYRFTASGVIDLIALANAATSNPFGNLSAIRKAAANSTSSSLLTYSGVGYFTGPESFSLPLLSASAGNMFLHPGSTSKAVGIRWVSPINGTVLVSGRYVKDTTTGASDGVRVSVYQNGSSVIVSPALINVVSPVYEYTNVAASVSIGDTLDFLIDNNIAVNSDHTNCALLRIVLP